MSTDKDMPIDPFVVIDSGPFIPPGTMYLFPTCDDCGEAKALCPCDLSLDMGIDRTDWTGGQS